MKRRTASGARAVVATVVACLLMPTSALAQDVDPTEDRGPSTMAKVLDALILRPLGLIVMPVGAAAFIPAALLTAPGGKENLQTALEIFITSPYNYVFERPLGDV